MGPAIFFTILLPLITILVLLRRRSSKKLPPGALGIPIIGQSLSFLGAMRANRAESWIQERTIKYGPISKLTLFGTPTVLIHGQAANKFLFTSDSSTIANKQPKSIQRILGKRSLLELRGEDHKRVRGALVTFLKPEVLKQYVSKMDMEVNKHLEMHWHDKQMVKVMPLMKSLTFDIICSLLFGLERGARREKLVDCFEKMMGGMWSVPINLPFTHFNGSLKARKRAKTIIKDLIKEKRQAIEEHRCSPTADLMTCLLSIRGENNEEIISEKEIIDNSLLIMIAGHDTTSILLTFLIRHLAKDPDVYAAVLHEHDTIAKSNAPGVPLSWDDLSKMKFTWRVAMETLRLIPPVFGSFRTALKDVEYGGYLIPKGWQIFWAACLTHHNDSIFPEPQKFDPTRFENQSSVPPYCFVAFGGGPRICPGYEFSKLETLTVIHYLITQFRWKLCCKNDSFSRDPMPSPAEGLPIYIEPQRNC
ncbi:hypothetical protein Sjap_003230 [Stephania japonica]|uniref:Cytochrome P450 n=1 Tax=Stephania japonica TaxID=461633 RepID=A0AAP0KP98_9MAGN